MNGVKEYIFPVYDVDADEYKEYIGFIRSKPELTRCKDCYFYGTFQRKHYCTKYEHSIKQDGFCAWAEPKVTE